jgi:hypothetical protein
MKALPEIMLLGEMRLLVTPAAADLQDILKNQKTIYLCILKITGQSYITYKKGLRNICRGYNLEGRNWFTILCSLQTAPFAAFVTDLFRQTENRLYMR